MQKRMRLSYGVWNPPSPGKPTNQCGSRNGEVLCVDGWMRLDDAGCVGRWPFCMRNVVSSKALEELTRSTEIATKQAETKVKGLTR